MSGRVTLSGESFVSAEASVERCVGGGVEVVTGRIVCSVSSCALQATADETADRLCLPLPFAMLGRLVEAGRALVLRYTPPEWIACRIVAEFQGSEMASKVVGGEEWWILKSKW